MVFRRLTTTGPNYGSLTLGGYDRSRFVDHDGFWPMGETNSLSVSLESITWVSGNGGAPGVLLDTPIQATIDSSESFIWLPKTVYEAFEENFNLVWDDSSSLYLVNDENHKFLQSQSANLTFTLGGMTGGSTTNVNIVLPYDALDLMASPPLVANQSRYYPLKRAANSTQFVIGRTLLQEAFIVADYERRNFSVYACQLQANPSPDIATILSPTTTIVVPPPKTSTTTAKSSGSSSKTGPIVGGVIGGLAFLAAAIAAIWYFCYWKPKKRSQEYTTDGEKQEIYAPVPPDSPTLVLEEDRTLNKAELANTQRRSGVPELEGSSGMYEMAVREEAASEMSAPTSNLHEMGTPGTIISDTTENGFPWRSGSLTERGHRSTGSGPQTFLVSPVSSPSPEMQPSVPSPSMVISPMPPSPSPPPVSHPQPKRVVRPALKSGDSMGSS
jgi:hypothetical protein